jgi:hypothetical protein
MSFQVNPGGAEAMEKVFINNCFGEKLIMISWISIDIHKPGPFFSAKSAWCPFFVPDSV